jgi:TldD protein
MHVDIDFKRVISTALRNGGEYGEVYIEDSTATTLMNEGGELEKAVSGVDSGAGIRIIHDNNTVYGYTNDLSENSLLRLAGDLSLAVKNGVFDRDIVLCGVRPKFENRVDLSLSDTAIHDKIALVNRSNDVIWKADKHIVQARIVYRDETKDTILANSDGDIVNNLKSQVVFLAQVVLKDGDVLQTGYEAIGGFSGFEFFDRESVEEASLRAVRRGVKTLMAKPAKAGTMPVILSAESGGTMVHEAVGHGLEADLVEMDLSVYKGKVGQKIASDLITVVDDATIPGKRGSFSFDDEGELAQKTVLIKDGVLKGYMYDRLTAMKDKAVSTGNGRRESYRQRPIVRMTNTIITPGSSKPDDIIRSVETGLYVLKMGGGQVNTTNGDFVFEVTEAHMIRDGEIAEPVRGATLTGNGPEVLKNIDMVGDDLGYSIGTCGKDGQGAPVADAQPTLRIPELIVGGKC